MDYLGFALSKHLSINAPLPLAGPEFRIYLKNSPRLFINGQVMGMYFLGYGNYGGYAVGSRLRVNNKPNRVGLDLDQKGPIVGINVSF